MGNAIGQVLSGIAGGFLSDGALGRLTQTQNPAQQFFNTFQGAKPLDQMIIDTFTQGDVDAIFNLVEWTGYVAGIAFFIAAFFKLSTGDGRQPMKPVVGLVMTGTLLIAMGYFLDVMTYTLFAGGMADTLNNMAYARLNANMTGSALEVVNASFRLIQIVGIIAFARGIFGLKALTEGHGQTSQMQVFTFMSGGVLAINISSVVGFVYKLLGLA